MVHVCLLQVEASVNAEAVVWHSDMQRGTGAWAPRALPAVFGDGPTAPPPERELLATIDALLAPDKPNTNAPSTEPVGRLCSLCLAEKPRTCALVPCTPHPSNSTRLTL